MFGRRRDAEARQAVEFSRPISPDQHLSVTRRTARSRKWEDVDQKGIKAARLARSYIEPFMKSYLKNAEVVSVAPPNTREAELVAQAASTSSSPTSRRR